MPKETLLERLQREARLKAGYKINQWSRIEYVYSEEELDNLIAHTLKEAAEELEGLKLSARLKKYDGNNLESACDAYDCAFMEWTEVIRYEQGHDQALTDAQRLLGEDKK